MILSARQSVPRTALTSKLALCGKAYYHDKSAEFATFITRAQFFVSNWKSGEASYTADRTGRLEPRGSNGKLSSLAERNLVFRCVKQRTSAHSVFSAFGQPAPPRLHEDNYPKYHMSSWHTPDLGVKAARAFFAGNAQVNYYTYSLILTAPDPKSNSGLSYYISFSFLRNEFGRFTVKQEMTCSCTPPSNVIRGKGPAPIDTSIGFVALWLSPRGGTVLTDEELDLITKDISERRLDLLEPLEAAFVVFQRDIGERRGFRPAKAADMCHDVLDWYKNQQPPWKAEHAEHYVADKPAVKYVVRIPAHHLGQLYVPTEKFHRALIALGSNIGDRVKNVEESLQAMSREGIKVRCTSFLYETEAMYYEQQDPFLNCVCEIETSLKPLALLDVFQKIETELGRVKLIDKGPRTIDLDILLYDFDNIQHPRLQVPHKLMLEREFVLRPLTDIIAGERLPPPHHKLSILAYLEELEASRLGEAPSVVSNLGPRLPLARPNDSTRETRIMAVLNVTPDSFSDGGKYMTSQLDAIESDVRRFIAEGASIIDVGGQSTRPGATRIPWQEELERVRPAIERIRSMPEAKNVAISIDTFYADVARGAVAAGADIINDVSGGILDSQMLPLIADLQIPIVLMHMRGTPETMKDLTSYPNGVIEGVAKELLARVADAQKAGIPRWRIVLDPGIGFAKTQAQNLELLRNLETLRQYPGLRDFPWLVGTSRKGFIGRITGVSAAAERGWGTAATVTTSIAGGADIVRVHDLEMSQVVKMADAMYRFKSKKPTVNAAVKFPEDGNSDAFIEPGNSYSSTGVSDGDREGLPLSNNFYDCLKTVHQNFRSTALDTQSLATSNSSDDIHLSHSQDDMHLSHSQRPNVRIFNTKP